MHLFAVEQWTIIRKLGLGFSYVSYMLANAGITLSTLVDETNFRSGNLDAKSCTATICLDDDIGPKRSTAFFSQHF